jgi:hypothetical protein
MTTKPARATPSPHLRVSQGSELFVVSCHELNRRSKLYTGRVNVWLVSTHKARSGSISLLVERTSNNFVDFFEKEDTNWKGPWALQSFGT